MYQIIAYFVIKTGFIKLQYNEISKKTNLHFECKFTCLRSGGVQINILN